MTIAVGAHTAKATNVTDPVATSASGSTFVVGVGWYTFAGVTLSSVTDNKGNGSYTQIQSNLTGAADPNFKAAFYYFQNGAGGSGHTFTANFSATPDAMGVHAIEITGGLTSGILDQAPAGNVDTHSDATPFVSTTSSATTQASEIVIAVTQTFTTGAGPEVPTWNNGYTALDGLTDPATWTAYSAYKILSSTGAQQSSLSVTGGTSTDALVYIATFKAVVATGTTLYAFNSVPFID